MLSIRFADGREWWASGENVERLFTSAVQQGALAPELEQSRHVADADGGFDVAELDTDTVDRLVTGLREAAHHDRAGLVDVPAGSPDEGYRASLDKFLAAVG
jgi:hypothetical protein